jgi:MoxR-like ATPase
MMRTKVGKPMIDLIKLCYAADRPLLLVGPHGVGKSEGAKAAADELGIGFISRDLSLMEPPDLVGLPKLDGGVTRYYPPAFLPTAGEGLLLMEELNRCPVYMRAPCLTLLTMRAVGDYRLPAGWLPAAAINPSEGDYEVDDLDPALRSRFVQVEVEADQQEWLAWARSGGVHPAVLDYVASDAEIFSSPESNPRAWAYVSAVLHAEAKAQPSQDTLRAAVVGLVGEQRGAAFLGFLKQRLRPLSADEVLSGYGGHRSSLQGWLRAGRLDLARGTLLAVLKSLQARHNYEAARDDRTSWKNLRSFLVDLPGDLRAEAERFFDERNYPRPQAKRRGA